MNYDFEVAARARPTLSQLDSAIFPVSISATKFSAGQNYQRKVFKCHTHTTYLPVCVCVRVHRISFMTHPPPWSRCRVTGGRQQEFTMTPVSWLHNLLHLHMAAFVPQSAWESTPSRGYLTTLSRRCYRLLLLLLPSYSSSNHDCSKCI